LLYYVFVEAGGVHVTLTVHVETDVTGVHLLAGNAVVTVSVTVFVHPLPWIDTVVVIGVHLAVTTFVCVIVSVHPFP